VNEPCATTRQPFLASYARVRVECARLGEDYSIGQIVPIRGAAPSDPRVPADAVTGSGSGLDPDISPAYAELQVTRVARARHVSADRIRDLVRANSNSRDLSVFGEPRVNVLRLNVALDQNYPLTGG
ncbi:MAG: potassium-transporting ATPase subunit C, partial [Mycobacterium sp.]